jgi:hypothetical protein
LYHSQLGKTNRLHIWGIHYHQYYLFRQPKYLAPEVLLAGPRSTQVSSNKVDVWTLGLIGAELALGEATTPPPSAGGNITQLARSVRRALSLLKCEGSVLERLARETATEPALNVCTQILQAP